MIEGNLERRWKGFDRLYKRPLVEIESPCIAVKQSCCGELMMIVVQFDKDPKSLFSEQTEGTDMEPSP